MSNASPSASQSSTSRRVILISYPKIVFLYPTMIIAFIAGLFNVFSNETMRDVLSLVFMGVFLLNLIVFAFDFPRTTSLTLVAVIVAFVLGLLLLFRFNDQILPALANFLKLYQPHANATFYFSIVAILLGIFTAVKVSKQFDYWEVTPNELLHHHGMLSDLERLPSPNLKIDKEITDVFEFLLLRSGRLILHPSNSPRAIVLDNVLFINKKEANITSMLGALQVQVVTTPTMREE